MTTPLEYELDASLEGGVAAWQVEVHDVTIADDGRANAQLEAEVEQVAAEAVHQAGRHPVADEQAGHDRQVLRPGPLGLWPGGVFRIRQSPPGRQQQRPDPGPVRSFEWKHGLLRDHPN